MDDFDWKDIALMGGFVGLLVGLTLALFMELFFETWRTW